MTLSTVSDTIWVRGLVSFCCLPWGESYPAPNTLETRTVSRGRKPQSIYLLQFIGTTWAVAPLRQVNNKITSPKNVLKKDLFPFLWSNHFHFAKSKRKLPFLPLLQIFSSLYVTESSSTSKKEVHVFCKEQPQKFLDPAMWPQILASGGENLFRSSVASAK